MLNEAAFSGRNLPSTRTAVDLVFPLRAGTYLVANGGSTSTVNSHFLTWQPSTDRQRDYHGQSFGVDLVKLNRWGASARGWRPFRPTAYEIFGASVHAPCSEEVLQVRNDMPDMRVPFLDETALEGNHVVLKCAEAIVILAHMRRGSVIASEGAIVEESDLLGEAGNSG
ncbi:hypothetical protein HK107_14435 [Parvularcula sp. ZS-1/3]|uniref:Uncharacterized protein n=2 Tax=Parvularcula mediterranea TaxID=2732508 RepID=A0A7Y3W6M9_9PROT|nr:hypothetical protein [Parvularcula mediterranea]